jgi:hypothetical protein
VPSLDGGPSLGFAAAPARLGLDAELGCCSRNRLKRGQVANVTARQITGERIEQFVASLAEGSSAWRGRPAKPDQRGVLAG